MTINHRSVRRLDQYLYCFLMKGNNSDRFSLSLLMSVYSQTVSGAGDGSEPN